MNHLKSFLLAGSIGVAACGSAWAAEFDGIELKMLAIGDTSVTRLAPIVGEFEEMTGAKVQIDMFPYPGLIDKIVIEASANSPSYQLMWVDSPWVGVLWESGALHDLTEWVMRDVRRSTSTTSSRSSCRKTPGKDGSSPSRHRG